MKNFLYWLVGAKKEIERQQLNITALGERLVELVNERDSLRGQINFAEMNCGKLAEENKSLRESLTQIENAPYKKIHVRRAAPAKPPVENTDEPKKRRIAASGKNNN